MGLVGLRSAVSPSPIGAVRLAPEALTDHRRPSFVGLGDPTKAPPTAAPRGPSNRSEISRSRRPTSTGTAVRNPPKSVSAIPRNHCPFSTGLHKFVLSLDATRAPWRAGWFVREGWRLVASTPDQLVPNPRVRALGEGRREAVEKDREDDHGEAALEAGSDVQLRHGGDDDGTQSGGAGSSGLAAATPAMKSCITQNSPNRKRCAVT